MHRSQWLLAVGLAGALLLAGCQAGAGFAQPESPTPSPVDTDRSTAPACLEWLSFYGLGAPGDTGWASDRLLVGYTAPANASVFLVAFEEGTVIGTTRVTTSDLEHGVTADGDGVPLEERLTGSRMIRVAAYTDTNENGEFDLGNDRPCKRDGQPVEAGPRRVNFSSFSNVTSSLSSTRLPDDVAAKRALEAETDYVSARLRNASCLDSWGIGEYTTSAEATVTNHTAGGVRVRVTRPYSWEKGASVADLAATAQYLVTEKDTVRLSGSTIDPC